MASSLSNLVNNLSEVLHRIKCKLGYDDKKCETCGIKYNYCDCFLEYTSLVEYKCSSCNKIHYRKFKEKLKERFFINTNFPTMITISLFYYYEKVFTLMNMWMIGKNSMKRNYLK